MIRRPKDKITNWNLKIVQNTSLSLPLFKYLTYCIWDIFTEHIIKDSVMLSTNLQKKPNMNVSVISSYMNPNIVITSSCSLCGYCAPDGRQHI